MTFRIFQFGCAAAAIVTLAALPAAAQSTSGARRVVEFRFTPTGRAQLALWIETTSGEFMSTVRLTQSVSTRGIGNRPGATLMNSGFRWPYGRREGVLPVWAHRRADAPGAARFPRVIFQDRTSEGFASRTTNDASRDDYFCLSYNADTTRRDALDAVSCASVFMSDKGRYLSASDVTAGYSEPWEDAGGVGEMRALPLESLYPPRRDVTRCTSAGCSDHADVDRFADDARRVMPDIDAVTMATPPGEQELRIQMDVPSEWPAGDYVAFLEVNVEGDYNSSYNDSAYPTPSNPAAAWDYWAQNFGYAYRGQPSVVFAVPFSLGTAGSYHTLDPQGYGSLHGTDGTIAPMDGGAISNDPSGAPGSGADRLLRMQDDSRFRVDVLATNVCDADPPPEACGSFCDNGTPCPEGFACEANGCLGFCDVERAPEAVTEMEVLTYPDEKHSHEWGQLLFRAPATTRPILHYDVRVSSTPITDRASFMTAPPANAATADSVALVVPSDARPGAPVAVDFGGMLPELHYWVAVRPVDVCNAAGPLTVAEVTTTEVNFTTVPPVDCFVATAAWGSPMEPDVQRLRRFRDRRLKPHATGRFLVRLYYAWGPGLADLIRPRPTLRSAARWMLTPLVALAKWLDSPG